MNKYMVYSPNAYPSPHYETFRTKDEAKQYFGFMTEKGMKGDFFLIDLEKSDIHKNMDGNDPNWSITKRNKALKLRP